MSLAGDALEAARPHGAPLAAAGAAVTLHRLPLYAEDRCAGGVEHGVDVETNAVDDNRPTQNREFGRYTDPN